MTLTELAGWAQPVFTILEPLLVPVVTWAMWAVVAELRRRGYAATYVAAIPRAFGAGVLEAQKGGLDPFSEAGRALVLQGGTAYLVKHVAQEATALGIPEAGHAERIEAQLGAEEGRAQAAVRATAATVAATIKPAAAVLQAAVALSDVAGAIQAVTAAAATKPAEPALDGPQGVR